MKRYTIKIVAILLTVVAILHIVRTVLGWEVIIKDWTVPYWVSILAGVVIGYLAYRLWQRKSE